MAHLPKIPASAYTPEMDTLGVIPNIPVFEGDWVPVNRNTLTPGTRPLQLLPLPGSDFPVRHDTDVMHGFQSEVDPGKACASGFSTDASAFWDLLDPLCDLELWLLDLATTPRVFADSAPVSTCHALRADGVVE
ncbi:hypothetical protein JCGZ_04932 [Jatropha curcas]|uniref:Uncharacterized protein n=1 Tax=Jatropha curcas TaxID=180498 RepID=A0A067KXU7_JATCU|nr:hypothetical protein JCGZ_04932 [Jatropha curcas]